MKSRAQTESPWSLVLAAGEGERMRRFVREWLGSQRPKQYCTFIGGRSMLQHTLHRAGRLSPRERIVTVVAREHRTFAIPQIGGLASHILLQPANRDTAPGVLLGVARVLSRDPDATVLVFPSDHFVFPEERFLEAVENAKSAAETHPDKLILLGVAPDSLELDYGWVYRGETLRPRNGRPVQAVSAFLEKPDRGAAEAARRNGALWNTMVMAVKAGTLWEMGWKYLPELMPRFDALLDAMGTPDEGRALERVYRGMVRRSFSSHLLERAAGDVAVLRLDNVLWSDWGRPERIFRSLSRIGNHHAWSHKAAGGDNRLMESLTQLDAEPAVR